MSTSLTLTALLLVLWLSMSAGTWADHSEDSWSEWATKGLGIRKDNVEETKTSAGGKEEEMVGELIDVIRGAKLALEADKVLTASALISGVVQKFSQDIENDFPDKERLEKFKQSLVAIKEAVNNQNKAKAILLAQEMVEGFKQGIKEGVQEEMNKKRGVKYLENEGDSTKQVQKEVEQKLQSAFDAIRQQQAAKAGKFFKVAVYTLNADKSLTDDQRSAMLTQMMSNAEKNLNFEQQKMAEQLLAGATMGMNIDSLRQEAQKHGPEVEKRILPTVMKAFGALKQEQDAKAAELIKSVIKKLNEDKSLTDEQRSVLFRQWVMKGKQELNKEQLQKAQHIIQGATMGLKFSGVGKQRGVKYLEDEGDTKLVQKAVEQKLQSAFDAVKNHQQAKAEEFFKFAVHMLDADKSLTDEQKSEMLDQMMDTAEKNLNIEQQQMAEQLLAGATMGMNINELHQEAQKHGPEVEKAILPTVMKAFGALKQEQEAKAAELLKSAIKELNEDKSLTDEQRSAIFRQWAFKANQALSKEQQQKAQQIIQGATVGLKFSGMKQKEDEAPAASPGSEL